MKRLIWSMVFAATSLVACSGAWAANIRVLEDFDTDSAEWRENNKNLPVNWVASGGPNGDGDSYISVTRDLGTATGEQVIFRANDEFDASGDAFVGNWIAGNVHSFSFWFYHDAPGNLTLGARFATSANFPGMSQPTPLNSVPPNVWTKIAFDITPSNPNWIFAGVAPTAEEAFPIVFSNVGNVQIYVRRSADVIPENTVVNFGLDKVNAVPEPGSLALAGIGAICGLAAILRRRDRRAG